MVLFTPKKLTFKGSKKQHQILAQTAYYQAGKIVVQTILPEQPPVALITLNTFGTTCSTSADTYIPIENIFNTQSCSFLESRLVSLYGGKAASLLIEYQQRFSFHDQQPFALPLTGYGMQSNAPTPSGYVSEALQSSASYSSRFAVGVGHIFTRGLAKLGVSTANPQPTYDSSLSKSQPFLADQLSVGGDDVRCFAYPKGVSKEDVCKATHLSKALQLYQYKSKICMKSSTFDFVKVKAPIKYKSRYKAKKDTLWVSKQSVSWGILPRALLEGQKPFFPYLACLASPAKPAPAKQRTGKGSKAAITVETTFLNNVQSRKLDPSEVTLLQNKKAKDKARLVKTCFAGAGNNIFQSTLGNIEIQTASRLARIMVNYWNFYSLNKISPEINYSLFKNYAPFPKAYELNALHNKASINSIVNNNKLGNFPHTVAKVARVNPPTTSKVNHYLSQYLQPFFAYQRSVGGDDVRCFVYPKGVSKEDVCKATHLSKTTNSVPLLCLLAYPAGTAGTAGMRGRGMESKARGIKAQKGLYLPLDKLTNYGDCRRKICNSLSLLASFALHAKKGYAKQCTYPFFACKAKDVWQSKKGILPHALHHVRCFARKEGLQDKQSKEKEGLLLRQSQEQRSVKLRFAGQKPKESVAKESEFEGYAKREYNVSVWGIKLKVKDKISQGNIIYRIRNNLYFAIAQSKHSLKICENKNSSYNIQRLSVENIGNYSQLNNNNFQLLNSLQFSNLQRDRFYPNWFRLYLPDMEATEFLKNVANYYFSLGLQTLLFPSSSYCFTPRFARRVKTASPFLTFLNKNTRKEKYKLFIPNIISYSYCPPSSRKSSILVNSTSDKFINSGFAKRTHSCDSMKNGVVIKSNSVNTLHTPDPSCEAERVWGTSSLLTSLPCGYCGYAWEGMTSRMYAKQRTSCKASACNYYKLYPRFAKGLFFNVRVANDFVIPYVQNKEGVSANARENSEDWNPRYPCTNLTSTTTSTNQRFVKNVSLFVRRFVPFVQQSVAVQLRKPRESNFCRESYETGDLPLQNSLQSLALALQTTRGVGVDYIKDPNFTKDQLDRLNVPFSLFLENQIFPLNYNSFSLVEKELLYNALVNSSFAKAFYLINQNRQLLDFLVDYLLRFQILRQHQILYLFSTLLLGGNKTA